jgi:hypothetical protein
MSQLGRISGPLLDANLNRLGVDLTFRNYSSSDDLLYLDVNNNRIGVNKTPAAHRAEIDGTTRTTNLIAPTSGDIATITLNGNTFSTDIVSTIVIRPNQTSPLVTMDHMIAGDLDFKDNIIKNSAPNGSVFFDPSGTGITDIEGSARVNGDLAVTGNFRIDGDLQKNGNIIVGDTIYDTVTVVPDFTQSLIPGADLTYDLGRELGDSTTGRWRRVYAPSNLDIGNLVYNDITVGNQLTIESSAPSISTPLSNDSIILNSATGRIDIERIRFNGNTITNLDPTALTLASTGIGYVRFVGDNALVIPAGPNADRSASPEVGDTRWNTQNPANQYLECFDGTVWNIATGAGGTVTQQDMEDLSNVWILVLG